MKPNLGLHLANAHLIRIVPRRSEKERVLVGVIPIALLNSIADSADSPTSRLSSSSTFSTGSYQPPALRLVDKEAGADDKEAGADEPREPRESGGIDLANVKKSRLLWWRGLDSAASAERSEKAAEAAELKGAAVLTRPLLADERTEEIHDAKGLTDNEAGADERQEPRESSGGLSSSSSRKSRLLTNTALWWRGLGSAPAAERRERRGSRDSVGSEEKRERRGSRESIGSERSERSDRSERGEAAEAVEVAELEGAAASTHPLIADEKREESRDAKGEGATEGPDEEGGGVVGQVGLPSTLDGRLNQVSLDGRLGLDDKHAPPSLAVVVEGMSLDERMRSNEKASLDERATLNERTSLDERVGADGSMGAGEGSLAAGKTPANSASRGEPMVDLLYDEDGKLRDGIDVRENTKLRTRLSAHIHACVVWDRALTKRVVTVVVNSQLAPLTVSVDCKLARISYLIRMVGASCICVIDEGTFTGAWPQGYRSYPHAYPQFRMPCPTRMRMRAHAHIHCMRTHACAGVLTRISLFRIEAVMFDEGSSRSRRPSAEKLGEAKRCKSALPIPSQRGGGRPSSLPPPPRRVSMP